MDALPFCNGLKENNIEYMSQQIRWEHHACIGHIYGGREAPKII